MTTPLVKVAVALCLGVAAALLPPATSALATSPATDTGGDMVVPSPTAADDVGDGLYITSARVRLDGASNPDFDHDHAHDDDDHGLGDLDAANDPVGVAIPSRPDAVILRDVLVDTTVGIRSRQSDGWQPWLILTATADEGPDGNIDPRPGIGPIWLGGAAAAIEVVIVNGPDQTVEVETIHDAVDDTSTDPATPAGIRAMPSAAASSSTATAGRIRARSQWATPSMGWQCSQPREVADDVHGLVIHHTAGSNSYSRSDVPAVIRSIYQFHTGSARGWCDIGYNFIVDRFGGVWVGRTGSLSQPVVGAHASGHNSGSIGVVILGHYDNATPTSAALHGAARVAGYAADVYGINPTGHTTWAGSAGRLRVMTGHRDLGATACPGTNLYARLPTIRSLSLRYGVVPSYFWDFLQRYPTATERTRWAGIIDDIGYEQTAWQLARTDEYAGLIVDGFYRDVLGRGADSAGRRYWLDQIANGVRIEEIGVYFYGSGEYYRATGGGSAYVTELYRKLLHREPDSAGLSFWTNKLHTGATPAMVADGFYKSIESRRDRVARLYQHFLGRTPDPDGHRYWAAQLLDHDDLILAAWLAASPEYRDRARRG